MCFLDLLADLIDLFEKGFRMVFKEGWVLNMHPVGVVDDLLVLLCLEVIHYVWICDDPVLSSLLFKVSEVSLRNCFEKVKVTN